MRGPRPSTLERHVAAASWRQVGTGYCPRLGLMCGRSMVDAMDAFCHPHRVRGVAGMWITASRHGCAQPARDATGCPSPKQLESRLPCSRPSDGVQFRRYGLCSARGTGSRFMSSCCVVVYGWKWLASAADPSPVATWRWSFNRRATRAAAIGGARCFELCSCTALCSTHQGRCWATTASCAPHPGAPLRQDHQHGSLLDAHAA